MRIARRVINVVLDGFAWVIAAPLLLVLLLSPVVLLMPVTQLSDDELANLLGLIVVLWAVGRLVRRHAAPRKPKPPPPLPTILPFSFLRATSGKASSADRPR